MAHNHNHGHDHGHHHGHSHEPKGPWWKSIHRDWRFWTGLILMILAMSAYVLSLDEAMRPWPIGPGTPVPAAP